MGRPSAVALSTASVPDLETFTAVNLVILHRQSSFTNRPRPDGYFLGNTVAPAGRLRSD